MNTLFSCGKLFLCIFLFPHLPLLRRLLLFIPLHPAQEEDAHHDDVADINGDPHDEAAELLVGRGGDAPGARGGDVRRVERRREGEASAEQHGGHTAQEEVEHLAAESEARQVARGAEQRPPEQHTGGDEGEVLKNMQRAIDQRGIVERGRVPHEEIGVEEYEGHCRVGQEARGGEERSIAHDGTQEPFRRADHHQGRPDDSEEQVLHHVRAEQVGVAQLVERGDEREEDDVNAQQEGQGFATRNALETVSLGERPDGVQVQPDDDGCADQDRWLPIPLGQPEIQPEICHYLKLSDQLVFGRLLLQHFASLP